MKRIENFFYVVFNLFHSLYYLRRVRPLIHRRVGYGLTIIAALVTFFSFFGDEVSSIHVNYFLIISFILLVSTVIHDRSNKIINDLANTVDKETKDLFYSYEQLREFEIEKKFKSFFSDFTRYNSFVIGVQAYNYNLLPGIGEEKIKLDYEYGSVQEGIDINALIQNYYRYKKTHAKDVRQAIVKLKLEDDTDSIFEVLDSLADEIRKSEISRPELIGMCFILLEQIESVGGQSFDYKEYMKKNLNIDSSGLNKRIGLYQAILYSDVLNFKEQHIFNYRGENDLKGNRLYIAIKAKSVKGAKKIFLIILNTESIEEVTHDFVDSIVLEFNDLLKANSLVESSFIINKKEGTLHDAIERIKKTDR